MSAFDREELLRELYGTSLESRRYVGRELVVDPVTEHLEETEHWLSAALAQLHRGREAVDASVVGPAVGGLSSLGRSLNANSLWSSARPSMVASAAMTSLCDRKIRR